MQRTEAANHFLYQTPPSFSLPPQPHLLLAAAELLLRHKQPWVPSARVMKPSPPSSSSKAYMSTSLHRALPCCPLLRAAPRSAIRTTHGWAASRSVYPYRSLLSCQGKVTFPKPESTPQLCSYCGPARWCSSQLAFAEGDAQGRTSRITAKGQVPVPSAYGYVQIVQCGH